MILGKGGYGTVYRRDGQAVKVITITERGVQSLMELSIMSTYKHSAIAPAVRVEITENQLLIYQELAECDLKAYIASGKYRDSPEAISRHFFMICSGAQTLRNASIVHGDIKPQNILVYSTGAVKLCDFGCSAIAKGLGARRSSGTINYNAPEVLTDLRVQFGSDIWSLGCVLYECISGVPLIRSLPADTKAKRAITAKSIQLWRRLEGDAISPDDELPDMPVVPVIFQHFPEQLNSTSLVRKMTSYYPEDRPSIKEVMDRMTEVTGLTAVDSDVDVNCLRLKSKDYTRALGKFREYVASRLMPAGFTESEVLPKAVEILSFSPSMSTEYLEASIHMSSNMHQTNIPGYHPLTPMADIVRAELRICQATGFRMHKFSGKSLFIEMSS